MKVTIRVEDEVTRFHLKGDFTKEYTADLEAKVKQELKHGAKKLLVEMDDLSAIDDAGYQSLGSCMVAAHAAGFNFVLHFEDAEKLKAFKVSSYGGFFTVVSDAASIKHELSKLRKKMKK